MSNISTTLNLSVMKNHFPFTVLQSFLHPVIVSGYLFKHTYTCCFLRSKMLYQPFGTVV